MSTQVQLFGVIKLLLGTWKDDVRAQELLRQNNNGKNYSKEDELNNGRSSGFVIDENLSISKRAATSKRSSRAEDNSTAPPSPNEPASPGQIDEKCDRLEEFINVSLTPVECTIVCPTELVDMLFGRQLHLTGVQVLRDRYLAIQIDGDGLDTGSRVLGVSHPLSAARISIFFLATYFSDYMLVPETAMGRVRAALAEKGFIFSESANSYVSTTYESPSLDYPSSMFDTHTTHPHVDSSERLLLTGARSADPLVTLAIVKTLVKQPKYFSVSNTSGELSFLVDYETSHEFPENALLGSTTDFVIPVTLDLRGLPEDVTGIVSGVASKLLQQSDNTNIINMSYLSTAKSGVVLIAEDNLKTAIDAFNDN
ncbi:hypothetical protein TRICI_006383 [Trichomonascus ciferrii]|uniref:CASTOR ACT domain-containing protein n=1 Tax=Trichomonascus ciferrii TaxID=44093 RepID=A0A642UPA5_9ASCO|nr:hypothetical protein TRICI_006383 [Trichomonascus ciferrii]